MQKKRHSQMQVPLFRVAGPRIELGTFTYYTSSIKSIFGKTTYYCYEFTYSADKHAIIYIRRSGRQK